MDTDNSVIGLGRGGVEGANVGEKGDSVILSTIKICFKNFIDITDYSIILKNIQYPKYMKER